MKADMGFEGTVDVYSYEHVALFQLSRDSLGDLI